MKVLGNESSKERKFHGTKVPGGELARVPLELSLQGVNWPGSEQAQYHSMLCINASPNIVYNATYILYAQWNFNLLSLLIYFVQFSFHRNVNYAHIPP